MSALQEGTQARQMLQALAVAGLLTQEAWRVLAYLLPTLSWTDTTVVSAQATGKALGIYGTNVNRALRQLVRARVLIRAPGYHSSAYGFNPHVLTALGRRQAPQEAP